MASYFGSFVEQLRAALSIRTVVEKHHKLRRISAQEYAAVDDPSLKINVAKNIWGDFGSNAGGGDIIDYWRHHTGCTWEQAIEDLAQIAGLSIPGNGKEVIRSESRPPASNPREAHSNQINYTKPPTTQMELVAVYDYPDENGKLSYQVCRYEWFENGEKQKTFRQRRHNPNGDWLWNMDGVDHLLYRLDELRTLSLPELKRLIIICEGEKDCETLREWGLFATTNSGGAGNWKPRFNDYFVDHDVAILEDNDPAGRQRTELIAHSLRHIAKRVRVLRWPQHWPDCPDKADVTDWRDHANGTTEKLYEILDKIPAWAPRPPDSQLGALRFVDLSKPRRKLEWLVKGLLQRGEMSIWFGDFGTGKSFVLTDLGFSIARNTPWMGMHTRPGLVLYQIGEGSIGFGNRMEAYRLHNSIPTDDDMPFIALRNRVNLFSGDNDVKKIIDEAQAWSRYYDMSVELIVIDTFSAASPGADENAGRDVGPILERGRKIANEIGAHVAIVHHVPKAGGTPRGWSGFLGNVDSAALVETLDRYHDHAYSDDDVKRLPVHQMRLIKQKDGELGISRQFILPQVKVGYDQEGEPITSCVVHEVGDRSTRSRNGAPLAACPEGYFEVRINERIFRCLVSALRKNGRAAPDGTRCPKGTLAVTIAEWQQELAALSVGHEEITPAIERRFMRQIQRAQEFWLPQPLGKVGLIDKDKEWVWRTDRKVHPIDPPPPNVENPRPMTAPGETENDLSF